MLAAQRPATLGDFLRAAGKYGCRVEGIGGMTNPRGTISYRRVVRVGPDGRQWSAQLPNMNNGDPIYPVVVRSLCRQLGLDPREFGF